MRLALFTIMMVLLVFTGCGCRYTTVVSYGLSGLPSGRTQVHFWNNSDYRVKIAYLGPYGDLRGDWDLPAHYSFSLLLPEGKHDLAIKRESTPGRWTITYSDRKVISVGATELNQCWYVGHGWVAGEYCK